MATNVYVEVENGNLEKALSIFNRRVKDSNLMVEYRKHQYYIKPSERKRNQKHRERKRMEAREKEFMAFDHKNR